MALLKLICPLSKDCSLTYFGARLSFIVSYVLPTGRHTQAQWWQFHFHDCLNWWPDKEPRNRLNIYSFSFWRLLPPPPSYIVFLCSISYSCRLFRLHLVFLCIMALVLDINILFLFCLHRLGLFFRFGLKGLWFWFRQKELNYRIAVHSACWNSFLEDYVVILLIRRHYKQRGCYYQLQYCFLLQHPFCRPCSVHDEVFGVIHSESPVELFLQWWMSCSLDQVNFRAFPKMIWSCLCQMAHFD